MNTSLKLIVQKWNRRLLDSRSSAAISRLEKVDDSGHVARCKLIESFLGDLNELQNGTDGENVSDVWSGAT